MWDVSSRISVATLRTAIHLLLTYLLTKLHFLRLLPVSWPGAQSAWHNLALAGNSVTYSTIKKFTHALSNKPFVTWLLTNPLHLKYVATLHCDMSLRARFAIINVSQGSVATRAKCGGSFNIRLTANLPRNLPVKTFLNRSRFDRIMVMSLWPGFFVGPPCSLQAVDRICERTHPGTLPLQLIAHTRDEISDRLTSYKLQGRF